MRRTIVSSETLHDLHIELYRFIKDTGYLKQEWSIWKILNNKVFEKSKQYYCFACQDAIVYSDPLGERDCRLCPITWVKNQIQKLGDDKGSMSPPCLWSESIYAKFHYEKDVKKRESFAKKIMCLSWSHKER
jgi:hypothetical protein